MLDYRHLHYFWVVTQEGGFARAAERLDRAVQTISARVRKLEKALGHQLLKPAGRGIAMTELQGQPPAQRLDERTTLRQIRGTAGDGAAVNRGCLVRPRTLAY